MNDNAVIYARYSSHSQNEQSIETQIEICQNYADKNGLNVIEIYSDKAKTGTNDNREAFQNMLSNSSKNTFKYVIVYNLSRFARNSTESVMNELILNKNGVSVVSATENINGDDDDPIASLIKNIMRGVNEYYSKNTAKNIRDGLKTNAKKGLSIGGFSLPLGYVSNENREILINEEEADIVKQIFKMFNDNKNYADIIRYLNLHNIKTKRNNEFNKNSIKRILTNKKYVGIYMFKGEEMPVRIPQIIDDNTFNEVQEKVNRRAKAPGKARATTDYILSGKLYCGYCEENMIGQSSTSETKRKYYYYICKNRIAKKCTKERVSKDLIEDFVFSKTREILTTDNINIIATNMVKYLENNKTDYELKSLQKELKSIDKQKVNLLSSLSLCDNDDVKKSIMDELSKLEELHNKLELAILIEEANQLKITIPQIKFFLKELKKGNVQDIKYRKMLIDLFIKQIYLYDDGRIMIIYTIDNNKFEGKIPSKDELLSSLEGTQAPPLANLFEYSNFDIYFSLKYD